ncbi:MAG TPA: hypothetical protein VHW26_08160 [Solirubrobacteraceae bacterium]|nr:hypothetical protein [Solirubrobacteraceae bacterium]
MGRDSSIGADSNLDGCPLGLVGPARPGPATAVIFFSANPRVLDRPVLREY